MKLSQISNYKRNKGFTLIELIVVMAVFLLIVGTAIAIFISIIQHQKRILAQQELLNQTSYAIEYMSKGLRMAKKDLTGDCIKDNQGNVGYVYQLTHYESGAWKGIKFVNQSDNNTCQEFFLDYIDPNNQESGFILEERKDGGDAVPITSTNFKINSLSFSVNGYMLGDQSYEFVPALTVDIVQPRVTISLDVKIQGDDNQSSTRVQTTISQRDLNK